MDVEVFSLSALLQSGFTKSSLRKACARFSCKRDAESRSFSKLCLYATKKREQVAHILCSRRSLSTREGWKLLPFSR